VLCGQGLQGGPQAGRVHAGRVRPRGRPRDRGRRALPAAGGLQRRAHLRLHQLQPQRAWAAHAQALVLHRPGRGAVGLLRAMDLLRRAQAALPRRRACRQPHWLGAACVPGDAVQCAPGPCEHHAVHAGQRRGQGAAAGPLQHAGSQRRLWPAAQWQHWRGLRCVRRGVDAQRVRHSD
jgi:hypothetical protein